MKRFIIHISIVLFISFGLMYLLQFRIDDNARHSDDWPYRTFNFALGGNIDSDIVVFGDSRAGCHFNTVIMDSLLNRSCFNLALAGYAFDYQYNLVIKPYLERNTKPELIVLEVSPQDFFDKRNPKFSYSLLPYINEKDFDYYIDECNEVKYAYRFVPFKYYGLGISTLKTLLKKDAASARYADCFDPLANDSYSSNFTRNPKWERDNAKSAKYFGEFVRQCEQENIALLLVCSPMHKKDFYDQCDMEYFCDLINSLALDIPMLDYSLMFGEDESFFAESTHLNGKGADLFTRKLCEEMLRLHLQ